MKRSTFLLFTDLLLLAAAGIFALAEYPSASLVSQAGSPYVSYRLDPQKQDLRCYWQDDENHPFGSIQQLKIWLAGHNKKLVFAMNGGMYKPDHSPQGLYIENQRVLAPLDTASGAGNFYLQPNGIFYLTADKKPVICPTAKFRTKASISYATQSGPMLVIDGKIHPAFSKKSVNLNIRNGVGILPNNQLVFALSKKPVSFYEFAAYFQKLGCKNALYLDGFVSRAYLPEQHWMQTDGDFGVIIGFTNEAP